MSYLDNLPRAWYYRGENCIGEQRLTGEIVESSTTKRNLAVSMGGYEITSGLLAKEGDVGLIKPQEGVAKLVRREISRNGIEYLAEL